MSFKAADKYTIGIISVELYIAETEHCRRLQKAATKLGWESYIFLYPQILKVVPVLNLPVYIINHFLKEVTKPEFNLVVTHHVNIPPPSPRYMFLNVAPDDLVDYKDDLYKFVATLAEYDGYIDVNLVSPIYKNSEWMKRVLRKKGKKEVPFIEGITTVNYIDFKPCKPKNLVTFGGNGGKLRSSTRYKRAFLELAKKDLLIAYGLENAWGYLGEAYKGFLPGNGLILLEKINESCIGLAIHSEAHNYAGIPTTRIIEIAAAGAPVISDLNAFVIKNFGNNVLYFDQNQSAEHIEKQLEEHIRWLIKHPIEAEVMARKAYNIYAEKFTAEKFLLAVKEMHDKLNHGDNSK